MRFKISCEQFARLSKGAYVPGEDLGLDTAGHPLPVRPEFACVRLQNISGKSYAIVTCGIIMAVEYLGPTTEPDGAVNVPTAPALIAQCEAEQMFNSDLSVDYDPISGYTVLMSTLGYMFPGSARMADSGVWDTKDWRDRIDPPAKKSDTAFSFHGKWLARMASTAPSNIFILPEHVQRKRPVVVRDRIDKDWLGVFLVIQYDYSEFAELPDWWTK